MPDHTPPASAPAPLACVRDLHFSYGASPVFAGLNLTIYPGLTLLLGGESCGKTSLLCLLAGVLPAQKGGIEWLWLDPAQSLGQAPAPSVYWMDPRDAQHDTIPARAYFDLLRARHADFSPSDLDALVQDLGLDEQLDKPLYMLSTGSKRKVWLAGAFASRCRLTLLDEPFAALDQRSIARVKTWLNRAAQDTERAWVLADYEAPQGVSAGHSLALDEVDALGARV